MNSLKSSLKKVIRRFISEKTYLSMQRNFRLKIRKNSTVLNTLHFEVHLVDQCNLNCKSCSHFSPVSKEKYLDPAIFERDCAAIANLTKNISSINLMGGEPLLHPQSEIFFDIVRKYFPACQLTITTNGLLLPRQRESFWKKCAENNVNIVISQYPVKIDIDKITMLALEFGVKVNYPPRDNFFKIPLDLEGRQNIKDNFKKCFLANYCIELVDGKFFTCCYAAHIAKFNEYFKQNLEITEKDYIEISKVKDIKEILTFLSNPIPFCRYCNWSEKKDNVKWEISKKEISEWT